MKESEVFAFLRSLKRIVQTSAKTLKNKYNLTKTKTVRITDIIVMISLFVKYFQR
jgi:hypothetical protein